MVRLLPLRFCSRQNESEGEKEVSCVVAAGRSPAATTQEASSSPSLSFPRAKPERLPLQGAGQRIM